YEFHELFIDAHLALAAVDQALNPPIELSVSGCAVTSGVVSGSGDNGLGHSDSATGSSVASRQSLRRKCGIVLKSGQIRNLHDIGFALGGGADAVAPYAMYEVALRDAVDTESARTALRNLFVMQHTGIEKVMSTMGVHEIDGY